VYAWEVIEHVADTIRYQLDDITIITLNKKLNKQNDLVTSPDLLDACYDHFYQMASLQQWLAKVGNRI
jgi:hypothetical protein